ncbi:hypothetical protein Btru_061148 [Bulinus truncatus]|nr:hypothetical protein Btru_061148 [Bulinus truncatus]
MFGNYDVCKVESNIWDYNVSINEGWNISFYDIYSKVLIKYGFFGWKRLALLPYGGLAHVKWAVGEIQVNVFSPGVEAREGLNSEQFYSIKWNEVSRNVEIFCIQSTLNAQPAQLIQNEAYRYQSNKEFKIGFLDYEGVFNKNDIRSGFNCPMLPLDLPLAQDQNISPIQLGLYTAKYGLHGVEMIFFRLHPNDPNILEGLKITGDPNVPAGNVSVTVFLNKPFILKKEDQDSVESLMEADTARTDEDYSSVLNSFANNAETRQPFLVPVEVFEREAHLPQYCISRYIAQGRIAGQYFTSPALSKCHFVRFTPTMFGVLWFFKFFFSHHNKIKLKIILTFIPKKI